MCWKVGRGDKLSLMEDGGEFESDDGGWGEFAGVLVELSARGADRCEYAQRRLAFANLADPAVGSRDLLPGVERRHQPLCALGCEEQLIVR